MTRGDIRIGLVGCGRLAERGYVPALAEVAAGVLVAVADPVSERCAVAAPGVPAFASAAELLDAVPVDALVLATPAEKHLSDARLAAARGVPSLVEKPPASSYAEALALAGLSPQPRFSFNRRFVSELEALREATVGEPELGLELAMHTRRSSWRPHETRDDALLGLGPHLIDLARWLSGAEIACVSADIRKSTARLELVLADGRGTAVVRCASNRPYQERIRACGATGLLGEHSAGGLGTFVRSTRGGHPLVPSLTRQLEAFFRVVRGESEDVLADATDGVAVMAVIEAARDASDRRTEVELSLPRTV